MIFITGPARSGKSRFAEQLAGMNGKPVTYCATARENAEDAEWVERIVRHRARRPAEWRVVELAGRAEPALTSLLRDALDDQVLLVDSLGAWLSDRMTLLAERADARSILEAEAEELITAACASRAELIIVGEEVGWDLVPAYPSGRLFRDLLGPLQQRLACAARHAYLVVSGYALELGRIGILVAQSPERPEHPGVAG